MCLYEKRVNIRLESCESKVLSPIFIIFARNRKKVWNTGRSSSFIDIGSESSNIRIEPILFERAPKCKQKKKQNC